LTKTYMFSNSKIMYSLEQIENAHNQLKSGAGFHVYVKEIKNFGVISYDCFVSNGHTVFHGSDDFKIESPPLYETLNIAGQANHEQFSADLKAHQLGQTDYLTFCADCAKSGIVKWTVDTIKMTCTYYDYEQNNILEEKIPE